MESGYWIWASEWKTLLTLTESVSRRDREKGVSKKGEKNTVAEWPAAFSLWQSWYGEMLMMTNRANEKRNVSEKWERRRGYIHESSYGSILSYVSKQTFSIPRIMRGIQALWQILVTLHPMFIVFIGKWHVKMRSGSKRDSPSNMSSSWPSPWIRIPQR